MIDPDDVAPGLPEGAALGVLARAPLSMVLTDARRPDNPIVYVNAAFERTTGYAPRETLGRNCRFLQGEGTDPRSVARLRDAIRAGEEATVDILNYRADGRPFWNRLMIAPLRDAAGEVQYFAGIQKALGDDHVDAGGEEAIDRAVREVQHRVKNHLGMVVSLIRLQGRGAPTAEGFDMLANRVESLKLLYDELSYRGGENRDAVALGPYLARVARAIAELDHRPEVSVEVEFDPFVVPMEVAVNLGLILSELLTNALRHAFPDRGGTVRANLRETADGAVRLEVADDGVGLPPDAAWPEGFGVGGRILAALVRTLDAELRVAGGPGGAAFTITVPPARRDPS